MRLLITGGRGFVGRHVQELAVRRGHHVVSAGRSELASPTRMAMALSSARPEVCIHLAWYTEPADYLASPLNLDHVAISLELYQALSLAGCRRFVGVGTCLEYADSARALSELDPLDSCSLYATAKRAVFDVLSRCEYGPKFTWARLFFLYGPGERTARLIPDVAGALLRGEVASVGTGDHVRDFLHIADVAAALVHLAESEVDGPVNIGSGEPAKVRDVIAMIGASVQRRRAGGRSEIRFGAAQGRTDDRPAIVADVSRLHASGFRPTLTLAEGIDQYVEELCRRS